MKNITSENFFSVSEKSKPEDIFEAISTTSFGTPQVDDAFSTLIKSPANNTDANKINKINQDHETQMQEIYSNKNTDEKDTLLKILAEREALSKCKDDTVGNEAKKPNLWKIGNKTCTKGDPVAAWCLHRLMLLENKNAPPPTYDHNAGNNVGSRSKGTTVPIPQNVVMMALGYWRYKFPE